jgi:hypothetical protein
VWRGLRPPNHRSRKLRRLRSHLNQMGRFMLLCRTRCAGRFPGVETVGPAIHPGFVALNSGTKKLLGFAELEMAGYRE